MRRHSVDEHGVVFAGRVVAAAFPLRPNDGQREIVKGAGITSRTIQHQGLIRKGGTDLAPMHELLHSSTSAAWIGRDAPVRSVLPTQSFLNPPPVPDTPAVRCTPGCRSRNALAIAVVTGKTVLDSSIVIVPARGGSKTFRSPSACRRV